MGTRWRGLLAPIDMPTGDGRRFKEGGVTHRSLPFALKWQRQDEQAHDASVIIGSDDTINIGTLQQAIDGEWIGEDAAKDSGMALTDLGAWGAGELFDDQPQLPRLSEDVAEAMHLVSKGLLGPSVDAGAAQMIFVKEGTDEPLTDEEWDQLLTDEEQTGEAAKIEMLFTEYEIAAATLVVIPAFAETTRPFEILAAAELAEPASPALVAALTAAAGAEPVYPAEWFADPQLSEVTPITVTLEGRVYGHVAQWGVCHVGIPKVCTTAPQSQTDYAMFHRYVVDTVDGLISVGRLTTGHGRIGTGCDHVACRSKDDHACDHMSLGQTIDHYDRLKTLAWLRTGEDEHGPWMAGVLAGPLDQSDRRVLGRRSVSGDWRDVAGHWELTEVLALAKEKAGFPLSVSLQNGKQTALLAAGGINPNKPSRPSLPHPVDSDALADKVAERVLRGLGHRPRKVAVTAAAQVHTGAMIALVPSADDAARLVVDGGEPVDELHLTLAYLGEAAEIDDDTQQAIIAAMSSLAEGAGPVTGDGSAISVFNPAADDKETAIVLGVSGDELEPFHTQVMDAMSGGGGSVAPEQYSPWNAHVTLVYSDDLSMVGDLADRTNQPVVFDTLRVAFGGVVTNIPLGAQAKPAADTAAALMSEIANTDPDAIDRHDLASQLITELETADV